MGQRGPAPQPTKLRLLRGNPGKRPINKREPNPEAGEPPCPTWLDANAKKEWTRITKELESLGLLTRCDMAALAGYCVAFARVQECAKVIKKHGATYETETGYFRERPEVGMEQKYLALMKQYLAEFGLSPSSRSRISVPEKPQVDPFEEFLKRGKKEKA